MSDDRTVLEQQLFDWLQAAAALQLSEPLPESWVDLINVQSNLVAELLETVKRLDESVNELNKQLPAHAAKSDALSAAEQVIMKDGFPLLINKNDPGAIYHQIVNLQRYEVIETEFLQQHLKPGHVFVDVGANIGYFSILAAHQVGEAGRVIAVEPDLENATYLRMNRKLLPYPEVIQVEQIIAGDHSAVGYVYRSATNYGDHRAYSALHEDTPRAARQAIVQRRLDDVLANETQVDIIKIDTQGFEVPVLRGLKNTLQVFSPIVLFEFWPYGLRNAGFTPADVLDLMADYGYEVYEHGAYLKPFKFDPTPYQDINNRHYVDLVGIKVDAELKGQALDFQTLSARRPVSTVEISFDKRITGDGWHRAETNGTTYWRWTAAPRANLDIWLVPRQNYTIEIHIINSITPDILQSLKVFVNGVDIALTEQMVESGTLWRGTIAASVVSKDERNTRLIFTTSGTESPKKVLGTHDLRQIGIAVSRITIQPIEYR